MRLTHLRLAGFKSFVEPTSVAVPSNLVGVVGPNGCGKSNIIDAVRWVLGESKASELRGESMQDVIFNGSTNRKPASRASVELVFDNAEGRAGGSWNQFAEISVKRVLTRDGTSTYYINQQAVRRRDVQDIFLGTGLGPRAYAIIGQGMIARIIEARPEELRVFLEEAAGVSKYKERRRETANRLQDTRDNLTRVEDILRELTAQIERLENQAEIARQYKGYLSDKESKQQMLWFIRLREAQELKNASQAAFEQARAKLEGLQTQSISTQTALISARQSQVLAQQKLDTDQAQWIESNRSVSRLEADLRVMAEAKNRLSSRLGELESERFGWIARLEENQARKSLLEADLEAQEIELEEKAIAVEEALMASEPVQHEIEQSRNVLDDRRSNVSDIQRQLSQLSSQQEAASRAESSIEAKLERLRSELRQIHMPDDAELSSAEAEHADTLSLLAQAQSEFDSIEQRQGQLAAQLKSEEHTYQIERDRFASLEARRVALQALNDKLADAGEVGKWIQANQLNELPRLLGSLKAERGWEKALESALRESLDAFRVSDLEKVAGFESSAPPARIGFLQEGGGAPSRPGLTGPDRLASRVNISNVELAEAVNIMLGGCLVAESMADALRKRHQLTPGERIFLKSGHWVSANQIGFYAADNDQAGKLERYQEIDSIVTEMRAVELLKNESQAKRDKLRVGVEQLSASVTQLRNKIALLTRTAHDSEMTKLRLEEAKARAEGRKQQVTLDIAVLESELEEQRAILLESEDAYAELDERLALASEALEAQRGKIEGLEAKLRDLQAAHQKAVLSRQDQEYVIRSTKSGMLECNRDMDFAKGQLTQIEQRKVQAQNELDAMSDSGGNDALQVALEERVIAEENVAIARDALEQIMAKVSELEILEKESDKQTEPLRQAVQDATLKIQAAEMTIEQYQANLDEVQADIISIESLLGGMDVQPKASVLQAEVTKLSNNMQSLGAVNLAALDELEAATERRGFLDQQAADLNEAMETLEDAIRKIDMETRELLQETFSAVNAQFSRLFPALFGGGEAKLVMTGDEILDAGVQVFAQPPGKKNGTIHLLSGGEKALTATALVFAIFELNPAPFCLLDEVDAPLDDANTERFSKLVKQMSERTQFLFISHNKIAMEMAQQLIGVTMQERGVSRIVAVDLASAEKLATETV